MSTEPTPPQVTIIKQESGCFRLAVIVIAIVLAIACLATIVAVEVLFDVTADFIDIFTDDPAPTSIFDDLFDALPTPTLPPAAG